MRRILLASLAALCFSAPAFAEQRINPTTGEYETVRPGDTLQFNTPGGYYGYAAPGARPELNRSTMEWEYPGQRPRTPYDPVPREFRQYQRDVELMERDQSETQYPRY